MRIDDTNGKIINTRDVYIHDDILLNLEFDRKHRKLRLIVEEYASDREFLINFMNVIGFDMTACDFWGASERILDFEYIEHNNRVLIPRLFDRKNNTPNSMDDLSEKSYVETLITFCSGDQLRIASEYILFEKQTNQRKSTRDL